ncbi:N-formylglutamate amidohydrolase [Alkaliphilus serpentinus]|uniref:N-formylglutamate amidohydrolase n=1 Tax=Alkaliphilus serpentinus TaxID=1482731 RepID=A0A833MAN2_9FIRM|nr:N-formylglutamate amidohydrolase [Alkaliphilus serpentinus]KAB3532831.1 N-formylglutamate amidohydrolase [Alkaliphilus serpentinus]
MIYSLEEIIEKALIYEKQFSNNHYHGNPYKGIYQYISGKTPIILSAPHAVKQIRDGRYKKADIFTGTIGIILQELTGCHLIYRSYTGDGDANRDIVCPYKGYLAEIIKDKNLLYLIDLHGMDKKHPIDIDIGTLNGKSASWSLKKLVINSFYEFDIHKVKFDHLFDADSKGTVTQTIWQSQAIHCIQMEINGAYRNIKNTKNHLNFYRLLCSLENLILSLSKEE